MLISKKDILSNLAKWIVFQSEIVPNELIIILQKVEEKIENNDRFKKAKIYNCGFLQMDYKQLIQFLKEIFETIPEYLDLNLSYFEKQQGIKITDDRPSFVSVSRFDEINPNHSFIDLDALLINICNSILQDQQK